MNIFGYSETRNSIGDKFRANRFKFFEKCIERLSPPISILDVGGKESFWTNRNFHKRVDIKITLLNLKKEPTHFDHIQSEIGSATDLSRFDDNQFDIAFSNSVIEHLYTFDNQVLMAKEMTRVGKHFFVQTPNKYFFIEPHFRLPFFYFLPNKVSYYILTKTRLSLGQKWTSESAIEILKEIRLLSKTEFLGFFDGAELYIERFFCLNKSFTAHNFK